MEETVYIGVKKTGMGKIGNEGDVWELGEDGLYHCATRKFTVTEEQIQQDFKNGFLIKATDKK